MDLRDYLRVLRKRWMIVVACTILAIGGAAAASILATPVYQAQAQLFVALQNGGDSLASNSQYVLQRVKSYAQIATSPEVLQPVIDSLDLSTTPSALADRISADSPLDTVLLEISATSTNRFEAAEIANAVATQLGVVIEKLEPPTASGQSPVRVTLTDPADAPASPSSPQVKLNLALGAVLGLALGIGLAILREVLDTTVKTPDQLQHLTGATPLGVVGFDPGSKSNPLVALDQRSTRAEAFRSIRTNLTYVDVDHPPRVVVITSALADEGKSTTSCNLAIALAQTGARVCLVEADLRRPRVADYLGLESSAGLTSTLSGQHALADVLQPWNRGLLTVLASGPIPPNPSELLGSNHMAELLASLRSKFDYVVLDATPLLPVTDAAVLTRLTDGALMVVRYASTTREHVSRAVDALAQVDGRLLGTVLNFVPTKGGKDGYSYGYGYRYESRTDRPRLGDPVPEATDDLPRAGVR